ncbi:hypothetical protein ACFQZC_15580 [Streptacidiphilus monticola]
MGGVFQAEARALIAEGAAAERPLQASVAYEVLAEFQALHGEPAEGEASARRALELFAEHGWGWRVPGAGCCSRSRWAARAARPRRWRSWNAAWRRRTPRRSRRS